MKEIEVKDRIKLQHAEYSANIDKWVLYGDAVNGSGGFDDGSYIQRYKSEAEDKHIRRKNQSYYLNHTAPVIDTYVGHLYKKPITRQYNDNAELNRFYASVNIKGDKTIDEFIQNASALSMTYGVCYAVIDRKNINPESLETKADEQDIDLRTYAYMVTPKDVINWGLGADGLFNWLILRETYTTGSDRWDAEHVSATRYRLWTRTEWFLYLDGDNAPVSTGVHGLGIVPVVPIYNIMCEGNTVIGRSEIAEISKINKSLFNKCSELDELMIANAFSLLTVSKGGPKKDNLVLGAGRILFYDGTQKPDYISPPPQAMAAYETRIANLVNEIYRIAKIDYAGGVASSGIALAFKFEKTNQSIARKAASMEDAERKIASMVLRWSDMTEDVTIDYPTDYGIIDFKGEAEKDEKVLDLGISETFNKEYNKKIVAKYLPRISYDAKKKIDTEIDAAEVPTDFTGDDFIDEGINADAR